jgi:hypothetical protein
LAQSIRLCGGHSTRSTRSVVRSARLPPSL